MPAFRAALIDLWDTMAHAGWGRHMASLEGRTGVPARSILDAFVRTRPARSIGTYANAEGDLAAVLADAGVEHDPALVRELAEMEAAFFEANVRLFDDVRPALEGLRARGIRTALVSNCSHATRPALDRLELPQAVDAVVLSFEVHAAKPDATIYRLALGRLGVDAADTVFVDDAGEYCAGAQAIGIRPFLIRRGQQGQERFDGPPAADPRFPEIGRLTDLLAVLDA